MQASHQGRAGNRKDPRLVFAIATWSAITLVAAVLVSRRLSGAFSTRMEAAVPCVAATLAVFVSLVAQALWTAADSSSASVRKRLVAIAVTLVPPFGLGVALWTSPSIAAGGYLATLFIVSALASLLIGDLIAASTNWIAVDLAIPRKSSPDRSLVATDLDPLLASRKDSPALTVEEAEDHAQSEESDIEAESDDDSSLLQRMTRRQLSDGREIVEGTVRVVFGAGEKLAVAHVSFVPPLTERPQAECHVLVDFDGRVRIAAAQPYGLRIEARRSENAAAAIDVDVAFAAQVPSVQATAA